MLGPLAGASVTTGSAVTVAVTSPQQQSTRVYRRYLQKVHWHHGSVFLVAATKAWYDFLWLRSGFVSSAVWPHMEIGTPVALSCVHGLHPGRCSVTPTCGEGKKRKSLCSWVILIIQFHQHKRAKLQGSACICYWNCTTRSNQVDGDLWPSLWPTT